MHKSGLFGASPFSFRRSALAVLVASVALSGCGSFTHRDGIATDLPTEVGNKKTLVDTEAPIQEIETAWAPSDMFLVNPLSASSRSGVLPEKMVKNLSFSEAGIVDVMREITRQAGLSLAIEGGAQNVARYGVITAYDISGPLPEVMNTLSDTVGFFWGVRGKTLVVQPEQSFVISLPPILADDTQAGLVNTLSFLGAKDVQVDRINRTLSFMANKSKLKVIEDYMKKVREERSMLVFDTEIFEVTLNDEGQSGINWTGFGWVQRDNGNINTLTNTPTSGNTGFTATIGSSRFSIGLLIQFLESQGSVKAIAKPRLAVMSGAKATFRSGGERDYVAQVGTNYGSTINSVSTTTNKLKTGLEMSIFGEQHDGTIYSRINLDARDFVRFDEFTALGTVMKLPEITERSANTLVRSRPGDVILMGGIISSRDEFAGAGGATGFSKATKTRRTELVIAIKTRVVKFVSEKPRAK